MRYISKAEKERHRWLDLAAATACLRTINHCEEQDAIGDVEAAVREGMISCKWEDQKQQPFGSIGPISWAPPISDMLPDTWELDGHKRLKDTTGRFRRLLLLKSDFDRCFKEQDQPQRSRICVRHQNPKSTRQSLRSMTMPQLMTGSRRISGSCQIQYSSCCGRRVIRQTPGGFRNSPITLSISTDVGRAAKH